MKQVKTFKVYGNFDKSLKPAKRVKIVKSSIDLLEGLVCNVDHETNYDPEKHVNYFSIIIPKKIKADGVVFFKKGDVWLIRKDKCEVVE